MESEQVRRVFTQREPHRAEYGHLINRAIGLYEDPTRYSVRALVDLFTLQFRMMRAEDSQTRHSLMAEFSAAMDAIHPVANAPERVYLYQDDNMPADTAYTENPGYIYDHDPDFRPYYLEMPVDKNVQPKGGVLLVAGGSHGAGTINECYQIGLELNAAGYQAFILQCRPNGCPYSKLETATDASRALRLIRARAAEYRVNPDHLAYAGFSNGGVTGDFCVQFYSMGQKIQDYFPDYVPDAADEQPGGPNALLIIYGARHKSTEYWQDNVQYPPTFFAIGREDKVCCQNLFEEHLPYLQDRNVPYEIHTFAGHPHGYAGWRIIDGKNDPNFDLWLTHAAAFLDDLFGYPVWQTPAL